MQTISDRVFRDSAFCKVESTNEESIGCFNKEPFSFAVVRELKKCSKVVSKGGKRSGDKTA
jgi:hypothetical protein